MGDNWTEVALPLLTWVGEHEGTSIVMLSDLSQELSIEIRRLHTEASRLISSGYLDAEIDGGMGGPSNDMLNTPILTERGARAVGVWPSDNMAADLAAVLEDAIADASSEEDRSRLRDVLASLRSVGEQTVGNVLATVIQRQMGL